jgi:hypothetical protein
MRCMLLLSLPVVVTHAWGKQGHQVVGNLATAMLSSGALEAIAHLLLNAPNDAGCEEYCSPLALVADWADQIRNHYHWSAALHYIDIRDDKLLDGCPAGSNSKCYFNYTRDCPNDVCVAGAICNYTQRLQHYLVEEETVLISKLKQESLMFLVHFIGDIHQPLHCARQTDRGGNSIHVRFLNGAVSNRFIFSSRRHLRSLDDQHHSLNLHAVWDDSIIETTLARDHNHSRNAFEASLLTYIWQTRVGPTPTWQEWLRCADASIHLCTTLWGEESWEYAAQFAYSNCDGTEIVDGTVLDDDYYVSRLPIVRERLAVAAVRLAATLELIFGNMTTISTPMG